MDDFNAKDDGFNPCPLCNSHKNMRITSERTFYEMKGREGSVLVHLECIACNLQLWSHNCKSKSYKGHKDYLVERWNKLGGKANESIQNRKEHISAQGA